MVSGTNPFAKQILHGFVLVTMRVLNSYELAKNKDEIWEDVYMKIYKCICRCKRYIIFAFQYYFIEKPRGLDFSMRDLEIPEGSGKSVHGYSKTNEKHLENIFQRLPFMQGLSLLDVGCGKVVVLKEAAKYPFDKVSGIDINPKLISIAKKNMRRLHLDKKIVCEEINTLEFQNYGSYNVFFFFNPFDGEILDRVIDKIIEDTYVMQKRIYIIYHNPVFKNVIEKKGIFTLKHKLYDTLKQYETHIYTYG